MVIYPESFSVRPNTEATVAFRNLFNTTSQTAVNKNLTLIEGNYVFCSKNGQRRNLAIANTTAADDYSVGEIPNDRNCAIVIENIRNMDIDCSNSNFIMDGVMTHIVIRNCENIKLKNLNIVTVNPDIHKISVVKASTFYVTFKVEDAEHFTEENGECFWYGTDYKMSLTELKNASWIPTATPENFSHVSKGYHPLHGVANIKPVSENVFNARFIMPKDYKAGQVFYIYPARRKEVGILIDSSRNVTVDNVRQTSDCGMGVVVQNSEFITINGSDFSPSTNSSADICTPGNFLQITNCRGKITVSDCNFDGAGGDCCNIHGVYFRIVSSDKNKMTVKFCNPRSYGFDCIRSGDMIAFVDPKTLQDCGSVKVMNVCLRDGFYYDLELATYAPPIGVGGIVENLSANPDFDFTGNSLNRIVGGGVVGATRGRMRIENNRFLNTGSAGIMIGGDANSSFEGSCIRDALIRGNAFMNCEKGAVIIKPEIRRFVAPVHRNIRIENNLFIINNVYALAAYGAADISMRDNVYKGRPLNGKWFFSVNTENLSGDFPK